MAKFPTWVNLINGVPQVRDFATTQGQGSPIDIDTTTDTAYYLKNNVVTSLSGGGGGGSTIVTPQQFGAVADGVTDDYAAFAAAIAYLKSIANDPYPGWYYKGSPKLFIPAAEHDYILSDTLDITHTLIIEGESTDNGMASRLRFADNKTGIRIQSYNTSGNSGVDPAPYHFSGSATIIRNLSIIGGVPDTEAGFSGSEGDYHGIHLRARAHIRDVYINGFRGDGIHALTSSGGGGAEEGNSNISSVEHVVVTNVRNGVFIDGADANVWLLNAVNGSYCRQHTVWDSSFLGNTHIGHHSANAGLVPGVPSSVVSYSGNRYGVRQGQATGASTNAPSGTTADNTWWYYIEAGGPAAWVNIPTWTNGVSVREGGGYTTDSANARNVFLNCYQEGGECPSQFVTPTMIYHGLLDVRGTGIWLRASNVHLLTEGLTLKLTPSSSFEMLARDGSHSFYQFNSSNTYNWYANSAVRASLTSAGLFATNIVQVTDDAYGAGWNNNFQVPTKNAVYDEMQTKVTIGAATASGLTLTTDKLLGRDTAGTGAIEEIGMGTSMGISGGLLNFIGTGGVWGLHGSQSVPAGTSSVQFTGLGNPTEILVYVEDLSLSVAGVGVVQVSVDNGANWYSTSGDYWAVDATGTRVNTIGAAFVSTNHTAARTGAVLIQGANVIGSPRLMTSIVSTSSPMRPFRANQTDAINAVRFVPSGGGTMGGATCVAYCFKR